jgi:hypothetical protein
MITPLLQAMIANQKHNQQQQIIATMKTTTSDYNATNTTNTTSNTVAPQPIPTQPINSNNNKQTTTVNIPNARQTRLKPDQQNHGTKR